MKAKIARRSPRSANNPTSPAKRSRRAVNPTKSIKAVRSVAPGDRLESATSVRDTRIQPTSFLTHSLHLRVQNLGRTGR